MSVSWGIFPKNILDADDFKNFSSGLISFLTKNSDRCPLYVEFPVLKWRLIILIAVSIFIYLSAYCSKPLNYFEKIAFFQQS
jgi:hypothetical protein